MLVNPPAQNETLPEVPHSLQHRLLEAVNRGHWVMAGLPLSFPARSLYGFPAMLAEGLTVVISPTVARVQSHQQFFANDGMRFPAIAVLDGTQTPHEQREVYARINHHQVRLICVTPKVFATLNFLNALIHATLRCVVVEDAHALLPDFSTAPAYQSMLNALHKLQQKPPLVLITQPLPHARQRELMTLLWGNPATRSPMGLPGLQRLSRPVVPQLASVSVKRCLTDYQKLTALVVWLKARQAEGIDREPVVVLTGTKRDADRLSIALQKHGFSAVFKLHNQQTGEQQEQIVSHARRQPGSVVLSSGSEDWFSLFYGQAAGESRLGLVYWQIPVCLEEVAARLFRAYGHQEAHVDGLILYTREDYQQALGRLSFQEDTQNPDSAGHKTALKRLRAWVLSHQCRTMSLLAYIQDEARELAGDSHPCGRCDECLARRGALSWSDQVWSMLIRFAPLARQLY